MDKKEQLKQLMKKTREQKAQASGSQKIDSPLVKYNNQGQAVCQACNEVIKTDSLWTFHCGTKKHKDAVEQLKIRASAPKEAVVPKPAPAAKSAPSSTIAPAETIVIVERKSIIPKRDREDPIPDANKNKKQKEESAPVGVPSDFFDAGFVPESAVEEEIVRAPTKMPVNTVPIGDVENLPRGFFDNPEVERQVRKEPVNLDKAFEEFKQEISLDLTKADDALEDLEIRKFEEEDKKAEEETKEMRKQMEQLREKSLQVKDKLKEQILKKQQEKKEAREKIEQEAEEELDMDSLFDWRSKG